MVDSFNIVVYTSSGVWDLQHLWLETKAVSEMRLAIGQITFMKNFACFVAVLVYMSGGMVAAQTCSAPCDLTSEISQTTDVNSLQAPPAGIAGLTGGCGFGSVTTTVGTCSTADATHKWGCTINAASSGHYTPTLTYIPGPVPEGCTYPDPATTTGSVYIDAEPPTVSITSPQSGVWVRREDNLTGEAQDDMQLFNAGAVACKEPGCGSTGAFSFPSVAGVEDFHDNVYYDNEKLKNAAWSVPIAGVVTCGKNPQTAIVQVRDSVFHLTEETISFNADCYPPQISISEPPMYGNGWTDPQNPVIKGVASDDGELMEVGLVVKDETADRYWNGTIWQAGFKYLPAVLRADGKWEYSGLTKDDLKSGNFTIVAYARDMVGRMSESRVAIGYKKRIDLGKETFTGYSVLVRSVENRNATFGEPPSSFIAPKENDARAGSIHMYAEVIPYRLSQTILRNVVWSVFGLNADSGNPFHDISGNPGVFHTQIPPVPRVKVDEDKKPIARLMPLSYGVSPRVEYEYGGMSFTNYSPEARAISQDSRDMLRQEYVDFGATDIPLWGDFDQEAPAHPGLLGAAAESAKHGNWHILKGLNKKFRDLEGIYGEGLVATSGYRCPVGNSKTDPPGARDSNHMYGKAFDFDQGDEDEQNWAVWSAAQKLNAVEYFLYTADHCRILNKYIPTEAFQIPAVAKVVCGGVESTRVGSAIHYSHGHAAW